MSVLKKEGFFLPGFKRYIIILFSRLVILVDILPSHLTKKDGFFFTFKNASFETSEQWFISSN